MPTNTPRVSIVIPAYNEAFFAEAFASARAQTYADLEIVVCDDSPGNFIDATVRASNDPRVRYQRNPQQLGFNGNFTECLRQARGELIKFLNDDDRLAPQCVEALAAALDYDPRVTLATSRRTPIDERGVPVKGHPASAPLSHVSCLIPGEELVNFVLINSTNVIGEPSTVMFRKRDIEMDAGGLFSWNGRAYHCLADLSLWTRLLAKGDAFYQAVALSDYRNHSGQQQADPSMEVKCMAERFYLAREARALGFLKHAAHYRAALSHPLKKAEQALQTRVLPESARAALRSLSAEIRAALVD